jgi:GTP cyclohydrolase II
MPTESSSKAALKLHAETLLPTSHGTLYVRVYEGEDGDEPVAIYSPNLAQLDAPALRLHSACFTCETLGCQRCDCGAQLSWALDRVAADGGLVIYLHQDGRGIGLGDKLRAFALQDQGLDTVEANRRLGLPEDARAYHQAAFILRDLRQTRVRLLTNNPSKIRGLEACGIEVVERIPIVVRASARARSHLASRAELMGHVVEEVGDAYLPPSDSP